MQHRLFIFLSLLLFSFQLKAQNWKTAALNDTTYFYGGKIGSDGNLLRVTWIDSFAASGQDTSFYFYKTLRDTAWMQCMDTAGASWLGQKFIHTNNGDEYYFNSFGDTVLVRTQAAPGMSWKIAHSKNGKDFIATVSQAGIKTIDGVTDSVKTISIQAYLNGSPVSDWYNNMTLEISKEHGWVKALDLYSFPNAIQLQQNLGAVADSFQHFRLSKSFNRVRLNKINPNFKYAPGNEWIKKEATIPAGFSYTLQHDSVISATFLSASVIKVDFFREIYHYVSQAISNYSAANVSDTVSLLDGIAVSDTLLPEYVHIDVLHSLPAIPNRHYQRLYVDTFCDNAHYLIKSLHSVAGPFLGSANNCVQLVPSVSGYQFHDQIALTSFGILYDEWQINGGGTGTGTVTSYPYLKLGNCSVGSKISIKPLSVSTITKHLYKLFPNPAQNVIRISGDGNNEKRSLKIFDLSGRIVLSFNHVALEENIDVSLLENGIYFAEISSSEYKEIVKFLVTK